jgi:hypothetical protein
MRRLIISTLISLVWAFPALAQDASPDQSAAPNSAQSQSDPLTEVIQSLQKSIQTQLAHAGFTDIQIVPTSFLISAKDRDGHSVTIMASPNSITEMGQGDKGDKGEEQDDDSSNVPSGHPDTAIKGPIEKM